MENEIPEEEVEMEEEEVVEAAAPANNVRNFRPRQPVYSKSQREEAIRLLDSGVSCRQVAKYMGPRCSSGTPIRWRQLKRKQEAATKAMEAMLRRPGNQHPQPRR